MRLPLLGMLLIVAGSQIVLVSFLLSLTRVGEDVNAVSSSPVSTETPYAEV